ncbi:MAG: VCBS repeat-containing protein, partial [Flavobacteriales bacterium]|nr:VCBS repeat-containing protein [Flavobacteriales bacterium]
MLSCALQKSTKELERKPLFKQVDNSGIDFVNDLTPTLELSAFDYIYFQNGGGVAVADFDQDGFEDVFFTSNLHPDRIYRNLGSLKFEDLTQSASTDGFSGGSLKSWSTGVAICDVNDDGYPDIYICKSGNIKRGRATENLLYINNKDFTFTEKGKEYGLNDANYSTQAVFFDYDLDGDLDAFILNHSPLFGDPELAYQLDKLKNALKPHSNSLYLNDGGHFRNVTSEAGLLAYSKGLGVVASDLDQDGWIDLYVANDFSKPDRLYLNQGDGTFKEGLKGNVGHISQFSMGCDIADMNNDGLLDISVVDMAPANNFRSKTQMPSMSIEDFRTYTEEYDYLHQYMFNSLLLNQGNGKFSEIAKMAGIHKTDWSWSTLLADFDNDGLKDNVVTNGYMFNRMDNDFSLRFDSMMRSYDRNPPLEARRDWIDAPPSYKLANYAWKNMSDLRFQDVSQDWGFSKESFSNGAAYSDLDNDGDLDLIVNNLNDTAFIFENTCTNNFLQLELSTEGRFDLNRFLNSTATLYYDEEIQLVEFTLSKGYQSSTSNILHFGLGQLDTVDSVLIQVPGEEARVIKDVEANQRLILDYPDTRKSSRYKMTKENGHMFIEQVLQGLEYTHKENDYDDFIKELLLPHRNSRYGPFISKGDVNNDGMEDIYIGGASGQSAALFIQQSSGGFASSNSETWEVDVESEDMKSCFFDVDNDGDLDLYVVSGGNAYYPGDS